MEFKKWLLESLHDSQQERHFLLDAAKEILSGDWKSILIYSDWLQEKDDPLGMLIQLVNHRRKNRIPDDTPDPSWREYREVKNKLIQFTRKPSDKWEWFPHHYYPRWVNLVNEKYSISFNHSGFKFASYLRGEDKDDKDMLIEKVPTELLKAGLCLYLERLYLMEI